MKFQVSKRKMRSEYSVIIGIGDAVMYRLLRYTSPFAYSARVEGWACDYYEIGTDKGTVLISTGYDSLNSKGVDMALFDELLPDYEERAKELREAIVLDWERYSKEAHKLLVELLERVVL